MAILLSEDALGRWDMTPGNWSAALLGGTSLWWAWHPRRKPLHVVGYRRHVVDTQTEQKGEIIPPWTTTLDRMPWRGRCDRLEGPFERPIRQIGRDDLYTWYENKLRTVSLWCRSLTHTVSKALATSRNTAPISLFSPTFLDTQRGGLAVVLCCVWVWTQIARRAGSFDRLLPLRS